MIYELRDVKSEQFWIGVVLGITFTVLVILALDKLFQSPEPSAVNMPKDVIQAYNLGIKDALKTNPPSMELETKCLELWANKQ